MDKCLVISNETWTAPLRRKMIIKHSITEDVAEMMLAAFVECGFSVEDGEWFVNNFFTVLEEPRQAQEEEPCGENCRCEDCHPYNCYCWDCMEIREQIAMEEAEAADAAYWQDKALYG